VTYRVTGTFKDGFCAVLVLPCTGAFTVTPSSRAGLTTWGTDAAGRGRWKAGFCRQGSGVVTWTARC